MEARVVPLLSTSNASYSVDKGYQHDSEADTYGTHRACAAKPSVAYPAWFPVNNTKTMSTRETTEDALDIPDPRLLPGCRLRDARLRQRRGRGTGEGPVSLGNENVL